MPRRAGQQMRPEFEFTEHEQVGPNSVEHAVDRPGEIERAGKRPLGAEPLPSHLEAGRRGARYDAVDGAAGRLSLAANLGREAGEQLDLAHAHAVQPDARGGPGLCGHVDPAGEPHPRRRHRPAAGKLPPRDPGKGAEGDHKIDEIEQHAV